MFLEQHGKEHNWCKLSLQSSLSRQIVLVTYSHLTLSLWMLFQKFFL